MGLHKIRPARGAKKNRKRVGRGPGSGHGKTATRGSKGAKSGTELKAQRVLTDRRLAALTAGGEGAAAEGLSGALAALDKLSGHRSAVDALSLPGPQATAYYTKVNAAMLDVVSSVAGSSREPASRRVSGPRKWPWSRSTARAYADTRSARVTGAAPTL